MQKISITIAADTFTGLHDLPKDDMHLMQEAIAARENAYAPYSRFKVGAAVLLEGGIIVTGNNQENAAYPSGMCAERVAIYKAGAAYPKKKILGLAISASSELKLVQKPVGPCGACRQALFEYEVKQQQSFPVLFMGAEGGVVKAKSVRDLLPFSFDASYL